MSLERDPKQQEDRDVIHGSHRRDADGINEKVIGESFPKKSTTG